MSSSKSTAASTLPNTYKDLWAFDLNNIGEVQHKLRIVRINGSSDNIAISRFNFIPKINRFWPAGTNYFLPIQFWPRLKLAIQSITPVADEFYNDYICNSVGVGEGPGAG